MYDKYSGEIKEETVIYILESSKSITVASKALESNINTVDGLLNIKEAWHDE